MSYILDALKRADADRARGAVPGLHTPPSTLSTTGLAPARSTAALPWLLGATALTLVGGAGWWFGAAGRAETPAVTTANRTALPAPVSALAASAPEVTTSPVSTAPAATLVAPTPAEPAPMRAPRQAIAPAATRAAAASAPPRSKKGGGRSATVAAPARLPTAAELPPDIRRQLPSFSHNGTSYSRNPAMRMLIVQSQVYREGDRLGPDWTLEQIGPKTAVLNFRGQRYQVPL